MAIRHLFIEMYLEEYDRDGRFSYKDMLDDMDRNGTSNLLAKLWAAEHSFSAEAFIRSFKDVINPFDLELRNIGNLIAASEAGYIHFSIDIHKILAQYNDLDLATVMKALKGKEATAQVDFVLEDEAMRMIAICENCGFSPWYWKSCLEWARLQENAMLLMFGSGVCPDAKEVA